MDKKQKMALILLPILAIAVLAGGMMLRNNGEDIVASAYTDGQYEGTGAGYKGDIKVSVTVSGGKITDITLVEINDTPGIGDVAAEEMITKILEAQNTQVDVKTGATVSSNGVIEAVEVALGLREAPVAEEPAEEKPEPMTFVDGTYEGVGEGFKGDIKVKVVVEGTKITAIELVEISDTPNMGDTAANDTIAKILEYQTTAIDALTGATKSSQGTIDAVINALASTPASAEAAPAEEKKEEPAKTEDKKAAEKPAEQKPAEQKPSEQKPAAPAPAPAPAPTPSGYKDGTYRGTDKGFYGDITLEVKIQGGKITDVKIVSMDETEGIGDVAVKEVANKAKSTQNANISPVTGATISSQGAINALKKALDQAK